MSPNPWERPNSPKRPVKSPKTGQAGDRGDRAGQPSQRGGGGDRGGQQRGGGGDDNPGQPSPWLNPANPPQIQNSASFVEYLRWMRSPHPKGSQESKNLDPGTKLELLEKAQTNSSQYNKQHLARCQRRLEMLAKGGVIFQAAAPWRIRVGGHRGPESTLLPAFDALGIPYIPSSTLRGVARAQAIREFMSMGWEKANLHVARWFGHLDASDGDRVGKIVFFDAYPLPGQDGLAIDMANNIWSWEGETPKYSPNPNNFLSLQKPTFLIGMKLASGSDDQQLLEQVKSWLIQGLQSGIGSQVNSGYGELLTAGKRQNQSSLFEVDFELRGQLIHGCQKFTRWQSKKGYWEMRGEPEAEVRPIAFKSSLRYWFRAFALGATEPRNIHLIRRLESHLFGGIQPLPARLGWIQFTILDSQNLHEQSRQEGRLVVALNHKLQWQDLRANEKVLIDLTSQEIYAVESLIKNLAWLAFHLSSVGQGARREFYCRSEKPRIRGTNLSIIQPDDFFRTPASIIQFKSIFQTRLQDFYASIRSLLQISDLQPLSVFQPDDHQWRDVIDQNCHIWLIDDESEGKSLSLACLHDLFHDLESSSNSHAKSLCGGTVKDEIQVGASKEKRASLPSPVIVRRFKNYQVVTVFGFSRSQNNPRRKYLKELFNLPVKKVRIFPILGKN